MDNQVKTQQAAYKEEACELLVELENALLELEEIPDNEDLIGRVFRAMHTIKGSGAMFGFDQIAVFTHEVETVYDLVREGKMEVTKELIDLSLASGDLISQMLDVSADDKPIDPARGESIIAALRALIPSAPEPETPPAGAIATSAGDVPGEHDTQSTVTYRIRFTPSQDLFAYGTNPILMLEELAQLGESHIIAHTGRVPLMDEIEPEACYTFWDIILTTAKGLDVIKDVFIFVEDTCDVTIQIIDEEGGIEDDPDYKQLGQILVEREGLAPGEINQILNHRKRIGEMLVEAKVLDETVVESALMEQQHVRKMRQKRRQAEKASSIRVDAGRLDSLVDLVGELVTVQARLSQEADLLGRGALTLVAEEVERLSGELRDNTMSIRMLPIGSTFTRFKRLLRDLSGELGKEIQLTTAGGDTELDKTLIEQLNDPLVHIIRNSLDHGIESPAQRIQAGKPPLGTVHIAAEHSGANVLIKISDDGAGLDKKAILDKAVKNEIIAPDAQLSEKEIFSLIFAPGFSTAKTVTDVSGRGVGLDVVRSRVENLRGSVEIESSAGKGSTITLKLPLTLAIIDGLMVQVGDGYYVLPLSEVEECVELAGEDLVKARKRNMMNLHGKVVPYLDLEKMFGVNGTASKLQPVIIAESKGEKVGLGTNKVIGQYQTVIKSLGKAYKDIEEISGATIRGDGTVALILDVYKLIAASEKAVTI